MIRFQTHDAVLRGFDRGRGMPLVFQHGLGGSEAQVAENVPDLPAIRRLTLECRGAGRIGTGTPASLLDRVFADDVLAFCDARGVDRFVAGGISMGAAIALRLAVRHPARVGALILARPAWLFDPAPENMRPYAEVAAALRDAPSRGGQGPLRVLAHRGQARPRGARQSCVVARLLRSTRRRRHGRSPRRYRGRRPGVTRAEAAALRLPTLVIGHGVDHAHPLATAEALASTIPGATLIRIPPKAGEKAAHVAAFRAAVATFLDRFQPRRSPRMTTQTKPPAGWLAALPRERMLGEYSLWSADLANLERDIRRTEPHTDLYHIDVADGRFAPSFLFFPDQVAGSAP